MQETRTTSCWTSMPSKSSETKIYPPQMILPNTNTLLMKTANTVSDLTSHNRKVELQWLYLQDIHSLTIIVCMSRI